MLTDRRVQRRSPVQVAATRFSSGHYGRAFVAGASERLRPRNAVVVSNAVHASVECQHDLQDLISVSERGWGFDTASMDMRRVTLTANVPADARAAARFIRSPGGAFRGWSGGTRPPPDPHPAAHTGPNWMIGVERELWFLRQ